jgi:ketosteroid isomerase-like protein
MEPADLHEQVQRAFNAGAVDALVALYEPDAWLFGPEGPVQGLDAIRAVWEGFVAMGGQIEVATQYVVEHGDLALLSNRWVATIGADQMSATTAEVARRQPDGTWRYVIDNPDSSGVLAG